MLTKYAKLSLGMGVFFSFGVLTALLLCGLAINGLRILTGATGTDSGKSARRVVDITIDPLHREELFNQLRKFAARHNYKIIIDTMNPSGDEFLIAMYGKDTEIFGGNPFEKEKYEIAFYDADSANPVSESVLDDLVNDLERFLGEIPGATFFTEKR